VITLSDFFSHNPSAYSNKSWSIASKELFSLSEVNEMEMEMLGCLEFRIGEEGVASIIDVIRGYEIQYNQWEEDFKSGRRSKSQPLSITLPSSEEDIAEYHLVQSETLVEDINYSNSRRLSTSSTSNTTSSSSSASSSSPNPSKPSEEKPKKVSHSIWNHFRPRCGKHHQGLPNLGNLVSFH
jgi:hypothetical protein